MGWIHVFGKKIKGKKKRTSTKSVKVSVGEAREFFVDWFEPGDSSTS
jgi:hypothetical protein